MPRTPDARIRSTRTDWRGVVSSRVVMAAPESPIGALFATPSTTTVTVVRELDGPGGPGVETTVYTREHGSAQ